MAAPVFSTGDVPTATQFNDWLVNVKFARKPANTSRGSTVTLTDDPDLTISTVAAGAMYHVTACLRHTSPAAADLAFQWVGPAGATFDHTVSTVTVSGSLFTDDNNYGSAISSPTTSGGIAGNVVPITCEGLLVTAGTSGTFKLQWAQGTSNASASTLLANSFIVLRRLS